MSIISFNNVQELSPAELCNFIQYEYYHEIKELLHRIGENISSPAEEAAAGDQSDLSALLFLQLKDEALQMIRNDEQVIFPLICKSELKKGCGGTKLPVEMIHQMDLKIITLLEKLRHSMNNYLPEETCEISFHETSNQLFRLDQQLQQSIHIKESLLLYKVKDKFNQPCSGNCSVGKN